MENPCKCNQCDKVFCQETPLESHQRTHTGERPFTCRYCDKIFSHNNDFVKHATKCTREKPYQCIHHSKAFSQNRNYVSHFRAHCGGRPHKWSYCDKNFSLDSELKWHVNIHTGDREYHCSYCDKDFHKYSGLVYSWHNYWAIGREKFWNLLSDLKVESKVEVKDEVVKRVYAILTKGLDNTRLTECKHLTFFEYVMLCNWLKLDNCFQDD